MEFFDKLVIPQSLEHIELLKSLSVVTLMILLPYLAVMLGSSFFSVIFFKKGKATKNNIHIKFSKDLIDLITVNKSSALALTLLPMFSFLFIYSQLLQGSGANISGNMLFIIFITFVAVFSIYTYKYSFMLSKVLNVAKIEEDKNNSEFAEIKYDFKHFQTSTYKLLFKSGVFGVLLLFIATYLFIGVIQFVNNSSRWSGSNSILDLIFSPETLIYYLYFLSASFSITAAYILYKYLTPGYEGNEEYKDYVQIFSLKTLMTFVLVMPVLLFVQVTSIPELSLSNNIFVFAGIILLLLLLISIYLYFMLRELHLKYRNNVMFLMLMVFAFMIFQSQSSFDTASQLHDKVLEAKYEAYVNHSQNSIGSSNMVAQVSGEAIFKAKCSACHSFDRRIVGPPYNETLPQFENNMAGLEDFIAHPRKINPGYPPMPPQGLKPEEVKAIAKYIMDTYKKNKK